ncbi:alanine aminotransferase 1-like [Osmerus mordax]|uniref:alanine aminotransferase 1-like n=1 Tax=Osmerus mordax TaxID=8014 RepID=UPI0035107A35
MTLLREINQNVKRIRPSQLERLIRRAEQLREELRHGAKKPYKNLTNVFWGDLQGGGVRPLSFVRQVLAACYYPQLVHSDKLPIDVRERAQTLLGACEGGSVGSYTATSGIRHVQESVARFICQRDGGVPSNPDNIYITTGSQRSIMKVLKLLVHREGLPPTGVLTPVPGYRSVTMVLEAFGAAIVPYYLSEGRGWQLQTQELHRALRASQGSCKPTVLYVINPGNPTGHVQSRKSIEEVIRFAAEKKLFLMADEVYQDMMFGKGNTFVSYKRVLAEMGPPFSHTVELASLHSASKGFMGEAGLRGGYVELVNLDPSIIDYVHTLFSTDAGAPVSGQLALELMAQPPRPGEPSYPVYTQETQAIRAMLVQNVGRALEVLNSLPGVSCQTVEGGAFVFPRLHLPPRAVQQAQEAGLEPDLLYCSMLLEEEGLCVAPGCEHGQLEGTHHLRLSMATSVERAEEALRRLTAFHLRFMEDFS